MKKFYHAHILPIFNYEVRIDSGLNHADFLSELNTDVQHRPIVFPTMDAQNRNNNIVMKLTNTNPTNEKIKFYDERDIVRKRGCINYSKKLR